MTVTTLLAAALAFTAGAALAQTGERSFAALDANGDGALAKAELIGALPGLAAGFDIADRNDDRRLDRAEFDAARALSANMYGEGQRSAQKRDLFRALDLDGDRAISRQEARWRSALAAHFDAADRNGDGRIGVSEFGLISIPMLGTQAPAAAGAGASARPLDENPAQPGRTHERFSFAELDANGDGRIVRTEAAFRADLVKRFSVADADGDGAVSEREFRAWQGAAARAPIDIINWSQAELRGGHSAYRLLGAQVRDARGEPLGEVNELLVSASGTVQALVLDEGRRVPWHAARVLPEGNVIVAGDARADARGNALRMTELLDDAVEIEPGVRYGNVDDLIIDPQGQVRAIVVDADASGPPGRYAVPWARSRFEWDRGLHRLPYDRTQIRALRPFDYSALEMPAPDAAIPGRR